MIFIELLETPDFHISYYEIVENNQNIKIVLIDYIGHIKKKEIMCDLQNRSPSYKRRAINFCLNDVNSVKVLICQIITLLMKGQK